MMNANTLSRLLGMISYFANFPVPCAGLEIQPEIQGTVQMHLAKLHEQLKNSAEPNPDEVGTNIRALYGMIWEPLKKAAERHHTQFRKAVKPHQTQKREIVEFIVSFESELLAAFERAGAGTEGKP